MPKLAILKRPILAHGPRPAYTIDNRIVKKWLSFFSKVYKCSLDMGPKSPSFNLLCTTAVAPISNCWQKWPKYQFDKSTTVWHFLACQRLGARWIVSFCKLHWKSLHRDVTEVEAGQRTSINPKICSKKATQNSKGTVHRFSICALTKPCTQDAAINSMNKISSIKWWIRWVD